MKTKTIYPALEVPEDFDVSKLQISITTDTEDEFSLKSVDFRILPEPQPVACSHTLIGRIDGFYCADCGAKITSNYASTESRPQGDASTPAGRWSENGEPDPHGSEYNGERSKLAMGHLSDDELANGLFVCDHRRSLESIAWLTAAKDRIRWLSRKLAATTAAHGVPDVDALAQFIRAIDGNNSLGAGALAERICDWTNADHMSSGSYPVPPIQRVGRSVRMGSRAMDDPEYKNRLAKFWPGKARKEGD